MGSQGYFVVDWIGIKQSSQIKVKGFLKQIPCCVCIQLHFPFSFWLQLMWINEKGIAFGWGNRVSYKFPSIHGDNNLIVRQTY